VETGGLVEDGLDSGEAAADVEGRLRALKEESVGGAVDKSVVGVLGDDREWSCLSVLAGGPAIQRTIEDWAGRSPGHMDTVGSAMVFSVNGISFMKEQFYFK